MNVQSQISNRMKRIIAVLIAFMLVGCGQVPLPDRVIDQHESHKEESTQNDAQSIGNMKSIGAALGCVFAPQTCQKSK
jgi:outer membrane biogenesis lipoprotein LolB